MTNNILRKRIVKLIAMSYALDENSLYDVYLKYYSFDKILEMIENNTSTDIFKTLYEEEQ